MPGTVLLLAASPVGKGRLVDAASVLPVLAAVAPAVLSGTETANVVELADPLEPQAVLTRLRAAATAPGPLTVFVTGQLQLDRKQHLPHLALARTTPATVRYTAFPWAWIREELRLRAPGTTTLLLDLHADAETWQWLRAHPLDSGRTHAVYGRIAPPPPRRGVAVPTYMKAVATLLRSGYRPPVEQLHQEAVGRLGAEGYADVLLAAPGVVGAGVPGGFAPRPPSAVEGPRPQTPPEVGPPDGLENERGRDGDRSQRDTDGGQEDAGRSLKGLAPSPRAAGGSQEGAGRSPKDTAPSPKDTAPHWDSDPHTAIATAVQAGRHSAADALAAEHEQAALRAHGRGSEQALHWTEVRADLAMLAGDPVRSCGAWLAVASARLAAGQSPGVPAVEAAVDRAHHQWGQIHDPATARELGLALAELRARVPGRRAGALDHVRKQLLQLQPQG
ncbi:hypothetical protein AB0I51_31230 [Streptomyces sp. NPDC050549]|uniref:hypothetical protein n=1 Tax=Streptomyces sp. NPDC050549 TaxID=3155406 RepID=UPI003427B347